MKTFITLSILLILAILAYYTFSSSLRISSADAKKKIHKGKFDVILDVRSKMEYDLGHYPDALHIPTPDLAKKVEMLIPNKEARILIYCNTGQRSRYAADVLTSKGYKNVRYIAGPYWTLL
jgi:phage shock protein E